MKKFLEYLVGILLAVFMAMLFVEAAAGCGEVYEDARGIKHMQDCVFFNK